MVSKWMAWRVVCLAVSDTAHFFDLNKKTLAFGVIGRGLYTFGGRGRIWGMQSGKKFFTSILPELFGYYWPYVLAGVVAMITLAWAYVQKWFLSFWAPLTIPLVLAAAMLSVQLVSAIRRARRTPLERHLKEWAMHYGYAVQNDPQANAIFQFKMTTQDVPPITVARLKGDADFVVIGLVGKLAPVEQERLRSLASNPQSTFIEDIRLGLMASGVQYRGLKEPFDQVYLSKQLPLDETLTKLVFMTAYVEIRKGWGVYEETVRKAEKLLRVSTSSISRRARNQR